MADDVSYGSESSFVETKRHCLILGEKRLARDKVKKQQESMMLEMYGVSSPRNEQ